MTGEEYEDLMDMLAAISLPFVSVKVDDVQRAISLCTTVDAMGALFEPTLYRDGGAERNRRNLRFLRAVLAFRNELDTLRMEVDSGG